MCYLQYHAQANGLDAPNPVQAARGSNPSEGETGITGRQRMTQARQHRNYAKSKCDEG